MAIQNNIAEGASQYGISFNNAYYRIVTAAVSRQRGTDPKFSVVIDLSAYATATPTDDTREVDFKRYNAPLDGINSASGDTFLDKCYAWVMSQSDMSGSSAV
tara:strand:+ start:1302 stop:1607 length:306 start_codon:yes stop_codon:yes gene_type:complete